MPQKAPDGTESKEILQLLDVGTTEGGENIIFSLQFEKERNIEWFDFHHSKVGKIIQGLMFGASVAKRHRPTTSALGSPLPELSSIVDISSFNATSAPGENFVVLRISLAEGVPLGFRIPQELVPAMKEKLDQAVAVAQSGRPSVSH